MLVSYSGWGCWVYNEDLEEMGFSTSEIYSGRYGGRVTEKEQEVEKPCIFELPKHAKKDITLLGEANIDYLLHTELSYIDMDLHYPPIGEIRFYLLENEPPFDEYLYQQPRKQKTIKIKRGDILPQHQGYIENVPQEQAKTTNAKQRKKLKPLQRETNTALLLLYDIFSDYNVTNLDELSGIKAWGRIISGEFTSEHIESFGETRNAIILTGNDKLTKCDFLEKYRKRFK